MNEARVQWFLASAQRKSYDDCARYLLGRGLWWLTFTQAAQP
jgi:hypothetical protein